MIIEANLEHLDDLAGLFDAYRVFYKQESAIERGKAFLKSRIENKESVIYLAYKDNLPVGFTQLYPKYSSARMIKNWILNDLYVDEKFRKEGLAQQLIEQAVTFAKNEGAVFIQLETQIENHIAQSLYKKLDFLVQEPDNEFLLFKRFL